MPLLKRPPPACLPPWPTASASSGCCWLRWPCCSSPGCCSASWPRCWVEARCAGSVLLCQTRCAAGHNTRAALTPRVHLSTAAAVCAPLAAAHRIPLYPCFDYQPPFFPLHTHMQILTPPTLPAPCHPESLLASVHPCPPVPRPPCPASAHLEDWLPLPFRRLLDLFSPHSWAPVNTQHGLRHTTVVDAQRRAPEWRAISGAVQRETLTSGQVAQVCDDLGGGGCCFLVASVERRVLGWVSNFMLERQELRRASIFGSRDLPRCAAHAPCAFRSERKSADDMHHNASCSVVRECGCKLVGYRRVRHLHPR